MDKFWEILANGAVGLISGCVGACAGAYYTLWLQAKDSRIKRIDQNTLYVEFSALKTDSEGYYIPGHGRIINAGYVPVGQSADDAVQDLKNDPEVKKRRGKVAFICYNRTAAASTVPQYVIGETVPI